MKKTLIIPVVTLAALGGTIALAHEGHRPGRAPDWLRFESLDTNDDGAISREEFLAMPQLRFQAADADGDGKLTIEELVEAALREARERAERGATRLVERLDEDGDGALTVEEMTAVRPMRPERMERIFDRLDANDDGTISQEEYAKARRWMRAHAREHRRGGWPRP